MARNDEGQLVHTGVYVGDDLETYLEAARQSREQNITDPRRADPKNRLRDAGRRVLQHLGGQQGDLPHADGPGRRRRVAGDRPGLKRFGEQPDVDALIRKYGYCGTPKAMAAYRRDPLLQDLAHAAAHLIHGSSEGRFSVTYAPGGLSKREIEGVGFQYADLDRNPGPLQNRRD